MSSLVWSTDLKSTFKASRNSVELNGLLKTSKSDEAKVSKENKQTGQEATTSAFWY
jgi:hypothetical protein